MIFHNRTKTRAINFHKSLSNNLLYVSTNADIPEKFLINHSVKETKFQFDSTQACFLVGKEFKKLFKVD